jgi:serine/threonine protein kinase
MHIKLCDFGWATHTINEARTTFCGTVDYVAPELVYQEPYDDKIDLWAIGILTYELLTGQAPFTGENENDTYTNIMSLDLQKSHNTTREFSSLSHDAKSFIKGILMTDPKRRMSLSQMQSHPWLTSVYEQRTLRTQ